MKFGNAREIDKAVIDKYPYRGEMLDVIGVHVRWLSQAGPEDSPDYGLRYFTVEPGGEIPIHKHFYHQTMFFTGGRFECWAFDPETDELVEKCEVGHGDYVYIPSMDPHGMRNIGDEEGSFLCCICSVYDDEE